MSDKELTKVAALYRRVVAFGLGKNYQLEARDFLDLVFIEQSVTYVPVPIGAAIVPVKYCLAKALKQLSRSAAFKPHQPELTKLSLLSKRASRSGDLARVLDQASLLLFEAKPKA